MKENIIFNKLERLPKSLDRGEITLNEFTERVGEIRSQGGLPSVMPEESAKYWQWRASEVFKNAKT